MINEKQVEQTFIAILTERENQWTYRPDIKTEAGLWDNLRRHINRVNLKELDGVHLTDSEFARLKSEYRRLTETPFSASQWLRGENGIAGIRIERDDVSCGEVTLTLFSNKEINGGISSYEVVNQIVPDCDAALRGDVTLLINGLPIIHIELKAEFGKEGYHKAFNQIERYAGAGFFDGIYATVQVFVISNKTATRYFARPSSNSKEDFARAKKFLFNWREANNDPVDDLYGFARKVLSIPMSHELISRYTILVDDKKSQKYMMVLRPYQIHAIKEIMRRVAAHEGGFIWHATGSGKTISSFVATKLLAQTAIGVARTVMIVDRKDLDSQTKDEFSKFASEYNTGLSMGDAVDNTLIVGIENRKELVDNFINRKNSNTIIITTIQKLSYALREFRKSESTVFDKLKGEHIVFIVDECHRAVSDREMKEIKKFFPRSTWIGLTGTPIFKENQKAEKGMFARTTYDQYGKLIHAYTTKNAMDDKSVLNFMVEYHSLMSEDEEKRLYVNKIKEKYPGIDPVHKLNSMKDDIDKEALLEKTDFENDSYVTNMLQKIFNVNNVMEKFKVVNGMPTMSAILTTHSIAQAKRIYHKLAELKEAGELITGKPLDERRTLNDPGFPRVAITYSLAENEDDGQSEAQKELAEIMEDYKKLFGIGYKDVDSYNRNINLRLARKSPQYQTDGNWLDLVIVVDRLLTGFDAPTIQTLYVDKELRWHGLLQAFSRTNRLFPGKKEGMIVTFRKPATMARNVRDAIMVFSNEARDWENLVPREYKAVKQEFMTAFKAYQTAKRQLDEDPNDLKKKIEAVKTFGAMKHLGESIKSYEGFAEEYGHDSEELIEVMETIIAQTGHVENLKGEIKQELEEQGAGDELIHDIIDIEFSADQQANLEEIIDSYYISQLLKDIHNEDSRRKFGEIISNRPDIVKVVYDEVLSPSFMAVAEPQIIYNVDRRFKRAIDEIITEAAAILKVPVDDLSISFEEYRPEKDDVPYINTIIDKSELTKAEFEQAFPGETFRRKRVVIHEYLRGIFADKLMPLRGELANFGDGEVSK